MSRYGPLDPGAWGASAWAWLSPSAVPTAFHEMCRDEYVMLMTWKKAAAGEIIYNKCPPNASGEGQVDPPPLPCLLPPTGPPVSLSLHPEEWSGGELGPDTPPSVLSPCRLCQPSLSPQCPGCGLLGAAQLCPLHLSRVPLPVSVSECILLSWRRGDTGSVPDSSGR